MNWEAFGSIAELFGAVAVVASLFYVGRQVRESSRATTGQTYESISNRLNEQGTHLIDDPNMLELCQRAVRSGDLDEKEVLRFTGVVHNMFRILESAYHQHRLGFIEENNLSALFHSTSVYFACSYGQQMWESRRHLHDTEFQAFVDTLIQSTDTKAVLRGFGVEE